MIELAPISKDDLPLILSWRNDWRIIDATRGNDLLNEIEHADWFERQARDKTMRVYKLVCLSGGKTYSIGICGLSSIDYQHSRAEFSLFVAPAFQRRGLGRMSLGTLLGHAFVNLGLNLVWGETLGDNPAGMLFESLGMTQDGVRREFYWKGGRRINSFLYSITREEFHAFTRSHRGLSSSPGGTSGTSPGHSSDPAIPIRRKRKSKTSSRDPEPEGPEDPGAA